MLTLKWIHTVRIRTHSQPYASDTGYVHSTFFSVRSIYNDVFKSNFHRLVFVYTDMETHSYIEYKRASSIQTDTNFLNNGKCFRS